MDYSYDFLFYGFLASVIFVWYIKIRKGSFFGGKIVETLGENIIQKEGIDKISIKVHLIQKKDGANRIGIEFSKRSPFGWSMHPIVLSKDETRKLVSMLNEASSKT